MKEGNFLSERAVLFFLLVLFLALFFEISATTLPLIVGVLILLVVIFRKSWVLVSAFLTGLVFDILTLRTIGTASAFLTVMIFLIFLYENKFETESPLFVFVSTFLFSILFLIFLGFGNVFLQAFIVSSVCTLSFWLLLSARRGKIRSPHE